MPEQVTFDHYELLTRGDGSLYELGRGSMGITYKAFDSNLRIPVALKVINVPDLTSEVARARFVQEARAAAKLRHRHVASVFHLGVQSGTYFYAMEFIDGETVDALVKRRGPLPELVALRITLQVARALAAAEQHSLVHRDIKPSNLMVVHEDDELCVKVIDFGLAKDRLAEDAAGSSTTTAGFLGTPNYASPEQLEEKEIDHRSDLYSLGATLWFMLAGKPPFAGPVVRIVSQHLSAEPEYASLGGCSPQTIALLRRMLAKNPDERFQKALEVRQTIEQSTAELAGGPVAADVRIALETASVAAPAIADREAGEYPAGSTIGDRYEVLHPLGATNNGWLYHARDTTVNREVRLMLMELDPGGDLDTLTLLEHNLIALGQDEHPNLLCVHGMEAIQHRVLLALEWTNGVNLVQLLRVRRKLGAGEVLRLLEPMAAGLDHASARGLEQLDLSLHQIHLQFAQPPADPQGLLHRPLDEWPAFQVKLNPMAVRHESAHSQTWAGGQTLVAGAASSDGLDLVDPAVAHTRSLAVLVYELLGGSVSPLLAAMAGAQGIARYTPLANLTEEGNEVLRRALDPHGPFRAAGHFYQTLAAVDELEDRHHEKAELAAPLDASATSLPRAVTLPPPPPKSHAVWWVAAAILVLLAAGGAAYLALREPPNIASVPATPETPEPIPEATPGPVKPAPTPSPATPVPAPSRRDLLKAATAAAEKVEEEGDTTKTIDTWMDVARKFPESEAGKLRLEIILDALRPKAAQYTGAEREKLDEQLRAAARLDVVSAMMLLGELNRETQPQESFKWFSAAAAKGVPAAATQIGLMLSNGMGVERDLPKAVEFFQTAADKGDAAAKAALGECLLYGKGVEKDLPRAIELLQQAASRSNLRALSRLGTCYHQGLGVPRDYAEALRLFKKAADLGSGEALGNLGVLYINGDGVPKNARTAVEYFQRGAENNDGYCMYLYARAFELGTGVTTNPAAAQLWYKRAAKAGIVKAIEWCKKNGVEF